MWLWKRGETTPIREYAFGEENNTNLLFYIASSWSYWAWSFSVSAETKPIWTWNLYTIVFTSWIGAVIYINWLESWRWTSTMTWVQKSSRPLQLWYASNQFYWVTNKLNWLIDEFFMENIAWSVTEIRKYYTYSKWRFWIN